MTRMLKIGVIAAAASTLALGLAACGDDAGSGDGQAEAEPATTASADTSGSASAAATEGGAGVLDGTLPLLNGEPSDLSQYRGKVVLVVNTASECGFTPQFDGLEQLYRERSREGFVILGFPADDIADQEPRSDEEIAEFCEANFGVSFPMFAKSNVIDDPVNPLFQKLSASLGEPSFNFNKYLLDRRGHPVERFNQSTEPDDPALTQAIDQQL